MVAPNGAFAADSQITQISQITILTFLVVNKDEIRINSNHLIREYNARRLKRN